MTTPNPFNYNEVGSGNPTHYVQPYYLRDPQRWAVNQEHLRHNQALWMLGEYCAFVLMWHIEDFNAGLVGRCPTCYVAQGAIAEAYGQTAKNKCPDCFGTTFQGGYKAIIVRPALFEDTDEGENYDKRGVTHSDDINVETTSDFRVRTYDYCFRQDGSRWQLRVPARTTVRTGFEHPYQSSTAITYNNMRAQLEDPSQVCYLLPPDASTLKTVLVADRYEPENFSSIEVLRAPLIPVSALED